MRKRTSPGGAVRRRGFNPHPFCNATLQSKGAPPYANLHLNGRRVRERDVPGRFSAGVSDCGFQSARVQNEADRGVCQMMCTNG